MTRINLGINPRHLSNKHLLAEHREIKRIPNMIKSGKAKVENIPENYTLGTGHVKFFYNKLFYLKKRYIQIYKECRNRYFSVTPYFDSFKDIPISLNNDYKPNEVDIRKTLDRLIERDKSYYENLEHQEWEGHLGVVQPYKNLLNLQ